MVLNIFIKKKHLNKRTQLNPGTFNVLYLILKNLAFRKIHIYKHNPAIENLMFQRKKFYLKSMVTETRSNVT